MSRPVHAVSTVQVIDATQCERAFAFDVARSWNHNTVHRSLCDTTCERCCTAVRGTTPVTWTPNMASEGECKHRETLERTFVPPRRLGTASKPGPYTIPSRAPYPSARQCQGRLCCPPHIPILPYVSRTVKFVYGMRIGFLGELCLSCWPWV